MRLNRKQMKPYQLVKKIDKKDKEGSTYQEFEPSFTFEADIFPAGGKTQAEIYGQRLAYMMNMLCYQNDDIKEGDGICVYANENEGPDYIIVSIQRFNGGIPHMMCSLEKRL